jgi:hypothetical protein
VRLNEKEPVLTRLTELMVRTTDLLEAEGRSLREVARAEGRELKKVSVKLGLGLGVILAAAPLALGGLGLLLAALFLALREPVGPAGAAAIAGVIALGLSGGLLWLYKNLTM